MGSTVRATLPPADNDVASTGRMGTEQMVSTIGISESSSAIASYERDPEKDPRKLEFTIVDMMTTPIWMRIEHLALDS